MVALTQLHEQRGTLVTQARAALDAITANTDDARATELSTRHDTIMTELDTLDATIAREERVARAEAQETERRARQRPNAGDGEARAQDGDAGEGGERRSDEQSQREYRDAFLALLASGGAVGELTSEQRTLLRAGYVENRVQTVGTNAAGGYTVPRTLANMIVEVMKDWGPMYDPGVTDEMMTSGGNPYDIPTLDDTANGSVLLAEAADPSNGTDLAFGLTTLGAFVYESGWLQISFELLQDSAFNVEALVSRKIGERLGRGANTKLTVGTGVNQPQGIVTASTLGKTAASAVAIAADEMFDVQHSVNQAYRRSPKARWMFADTTLLALRKLKDGQGNYLWQMGDVRANAPDVILGKPYSINDDMPPIATGNRAVLFGDFSRYTVRKVGSPLIGVVRERFWPKIGLDGLIRYDGKLIDAAAIKHLKLA